MRPTKEGLWLAPTNPVQPFRDLIHLQGYFHQLQMLLVDLGIDLGFDFGLHDVKDRQFKSHSCQGPCPCRVAMRYGLCIKFCTLSIWSTNNDHQVVFSVLLNHLLDTFLTFQIKCTRRCSHKALGLNQ